MSRRIIPVADFSAAPVISGPVQTPSGVLHDTLSRPLRDLRISVTDRCNFRCVYCMPRAVFDKDYAFLPHSALLSFEEIERLARLFVAHGVEKIRLTGGEPLLRKNLEFLIERLAQLTTPDRPPARSDADHQRLAAGAQGAQPERRRPDAASRSVSTRSTTPCFAG